MDINTADIPPFIWRLISIWFARLTLFHHVPPRYFLVGRRIHLFPGRNASTNQFQGCRFPAQQHNRAPGSSSRAAFNSFNLSPLKSPKFSIITSARTPPASPASSYRSTRPTIPPMDKWTVTSLRQALKNSDIQAPRKFSKAELYDLYKHLKPTNLSSKSTPATKKGKKYSKPAATPHRTPPLSSSSRTSSLRTPNSGARPSASQGHAPGSGEDTAAAQPSAAAPPSAIPRPTTQVGAWPLRRQSRPRGPPPLAQSPRPKLAFGRNGPLIQPRRPLF